MRFSLAFILAVACVTGCSSPEETVVVEEPGVGGAGGSVAEGGAGGSSATGGQGGGLPEPTEVALPFTEDFESYGISTVSPFGPWIGEDTGSVQLGLDAEGLETQIGETNGLVLPGTFTNVRLDVDFLTAPTYASIHVQLRSNTVGEYGYELVVGTNYGKLDFALWKEKESYTKKIAAPASITGWGPDDWAHVRIDIVGGRIRVYFEDDLIADVTDDDVPVTEGSMALWGRFDNVSLTALEVVD